MRFVIHSTSGDMPEHITETAEIPIADAAGETRTFHVVNFNTLEDLVAFAGEHQIIINDNGRESVSPVGGPIGTRLACPIGIPVIEIYDAYRE